MMNAQKLVFSGNEEKLDAREVFKIREENRYFKRQYEILAEKLKLNDEY